MLSTGGATTPDTRRSVEAFAASQWGRDRENTHPLPSELEPYLKKLSLHAYKITDDDINNLRQDGYTDEMLYEITIVGSVGAALVGLEKLFEALYD